MTNRNMLRAKIAEAGLTQSELTKIVGMTERTLSKKINGKSIFNTLEVVRICEALNITDNNEKASIFLR